MKPSRVGADALILCVLAAGLAAGLFVAIRSGTDGEPPVVAARPIEPSPGDAFIGDHACQECHPGESAQYVTSGHSRTLRPAADRRLARELDGASANDPERPGVSWSYHLRDGRFVVERIEGGERRVLPIDYAFGSGHHATTFLSMIDRDPDQPRTLEHRLTYYSKDGVFGLTPAQAADSGLDRGGPDGYVLPSDETLKCFGCHTTVTSARSLDRLDLETMIPNVSCERCHGPARSHVAAARRGDSDLSLPFGNGNWTADAMMSFCGDCHRHPANAPPGVIVPENRQIARFQPVGLMQSRCYLESEGAMSCVTCHNPHDRTESSPAFYRRICLDCHGPSSPTPDHAEPPGDDCVRCHMPGIDPGQSILFADHWVRVRDEPELRGPCSRPAASAEAAGALVGEPSVPPQSTGTRKREPL